MRMQAPFIAVAVAVNSGTQPLPERSGLFEELQSIWSKQLASLPGGDAISVGQIAAIALLLVLGYVTSRVVGYLLSRRLASTKLRPDAIHLISRIAFYGILTVVVLTALSLLHIPLTAFAFVSGALAIGVGFGAQNVLSNFISGWILMAEKPIRIDDFVEIEGTAGIVEKIGNRSTRIRRTDGVHMLVPNSLVLERTVVNWTLIDHSIRSLVRVGVAYGSDVRLVRDLFLRALCEQPETRETPPPTVVFEDFGDNALIFDGYFWCDVAGEREIRMVRSDVRFRVTELFNEHGIVIAFPQQDVHFDAKAPLEVRMLPPD